MDCVVYATVIVVIVGDVLELGDSGSGGGGASGRRVGIVVGVEDVGFEGCLDGLVIAGRRDGVYESGGGVVLKDC